MFVDINKYVQLLIDYSLTEHQVLILQLISDNDVEAIKLYRKYKSFDKEQFEDLLKRGLLKKKSDGINFYTEINLFIEDDSALFMKELMDAYPNNININGNMTSAKSVIIDDLAEYYYHKVIKGNKNKHKEILDITKRHFQYESYAKMGIEKYIKSAEYERIRSTNTGSRPIGI